jgi:hypothetical protein
MRIITKVLKQKAVWWSMTGTDSTGAHEFADPVEVSVRWDENMKQFVDSNGVKDVSKAQVMVDRDMKVGDALMLGTLDNDITSNPNAHTGAGFVRGWTKTPTLNGKKFVRTCYL